MTECSNCDEEFQGTGLCPDCLAELGIQKGTAEHLDLMDDPTNPGFSSDGDGPLDGEISPG